MFDRKPKNQKDARKIRSKGRFQELIELDSIRSMCDQVRETGEYKDTNTSDMSRESIALDKKSKNG